jgi:Tol biopolymer transport system component
VTSLEGFELGSSFSPDGRQIAFSWDGGPTKQPGIYIQLVAGGTPVRLSKASAQDLFPVWSPDGSRIAFLRREAASPGLTIVVVPAVGGAETRVAEVLDHQGYANPLAWTPDGKALLVRDQLPGDSTRIVRISLEGVKSPVTFPRGEADGIPTPSPDGKILAFSRISSDHRVQVCVQPLQEQPGEPRCMAPARGHQGIAWARDNRHIYVGTRPGLIRVDTVTGSETKVADGRYLFLTGDSRGERFAFSYSYQDYNIWRYSENGTAEKWIAASDEDSEPAYSPDGKRIVFRSRRTGFNEFWVCEQDGSKPRQITRLKGRVESPRWSTDGKQIAFWGVRENEERLAQIFVVPSDGSADAKAVSKGPDAAGVPLWSPDGKWLLYAQAGLWRLPSTLPENAKPEKIADFYVFDSFPSADGKWIYFTRGYDIKGLWRMPAEGGQTEPELIPGTEGAGNYRYLDFAGKAATFIEVGKSKIVRRFDTESGKLQTLFTLPAETELYLGPRGMAVSPDGRHLLITKLDTRIGDIRMIDNLR